MQTDGELQVKGSLATAADGIVKLSMHLDMLFMQISIYQGYAGQTVAVLIVWVGCHPDQYMVLAESTVDVFA